METVIPATKKDSRIRHPTIDDNSPGHYLAVAVKEYDIPTTPGFYPNDPENIGKQTSTFTPGEIVPEQTVPEQTIQKPQRSQGYKFFLEQANNFISKSGIKIKGWVLKQNIRRGMKNGLYLVEDGSFKDPDTGVEVKHCAMIFINGRKWGYFDPMGKPLPKGIGVEVENNYTQYQKQGYYTCFLHVLYYIKQRMYFGSMKKALDSYPSNKAEFLHLNEEHVYYYIYQSLSYVDFLTLTSNIYVPIDINLSLINTLLRDLTIQDKYGPLNRDIVKRNMKRQEINPNQWQQTVRLIKPRYKPYKLSSSIRKTARERETDIKRVSTENCKGKIALEPALLPRALCLH